MDDTLVRIPMGYDLVRAEFIRAAVEDSGIVCRLVRNEHPETGGLVGLSPAYLLVIAGDEEDARDIIDSMYPLD